MGKVDENKKEKLERLLDAAFELFTDQGIVKTTVADITRKSGVAKGTFYLYFKDKYELHSMLITRRSRRIFDRAVRHTESCSYETVEDWMILVIDDVLAQFTADPLLLVFVDKNLSWGIFRQAMEKDKEGEESYLAYFRRQLSLQPEVTWDAPEIMLYSIIELVGSTVHSVILQKDPCDLDHYKPYLHKAIRSIVAAHKVVEPV